MHTNAREAQRPLRRRLDRLARQGRLVALVGGALIAAAPANAQALPWVTSASVGANEVALTLDLTCSGGGLVCNLLDSYVDMQTAALSGSGSVDIDDVADTFRFLQDGTRNLQDGMGPVPSYLTTVASDVDFAAIPLVGIPMLRSSSVFALDDPLIGAAGLDLSIPGDYPFSAMLSYSAISDVVGDLNTQLPVIIVPPEPIPVTGTFRVLPGGGSELHDLAGSFSFQNATTLLGENVIVDVTADLTLNLLVDPPPPVPVPAVPVWGLAQLFVGLLAGGGLLLRTTVRAPLVASDDTP